MKKIRHNNKLKYIVAASALLIIAGVATSQTAFNTSQQNNSTNMSTNTSDNLTPSTLSEDLTEINGSVDTVVLATSDTYPDALTATPAAERIGAPVLLTDSESLSDSTAQTLEDTNVSNVIMVGGTAVISEEVEDSVEDHVNSTTRVWGLTQVGTSADTATFFWDSSDEATVVQYDALGQNEDGYQLLVAAKEKAMAENEPLLISGQGNLSNKTVQAMDELGVEDTEVYTTSSSNESLNVEGVNLDINQGDTDELVNSLQSNLEAEIDSELNIVAASDYTHTMGTNFNNPTIYLFPDTDTNESLEFLEDSSVEEITLTGDNDRLQDVEESIDNMETDIEISTVEGEPVFLSNEMFRTDFGTWVEQQEQNLEEWVDSLDSDQLETELEDTRDQADDLDNQSEFDKMFDDADTALEDGNLFDAKLLINDAQSEIEKVNFDQLSAGEIIDEVQEDVGEVSNSATELSENLTDDDVGVNASVNVS